MSEDLIRYEALVLDALRGVVRSVLQRVQKRGVPGEHHFFITFDTGAPGVGISKRLKDQYPQEMTIVLQHQFWDLIVTDDRFEVRLSFNNIPERLTIPFAAVRIFQDPSVTFGLTLRPPEGALPDLKDEDDDLEAAIHLLPSPKNTEDHLADKSDQSAEELAVESIDPSKETAKVVSLDKFRKK